MAQEKKQKMILPSLDDFFSTEESRIEASLEKVQDISISLIDDFKNNPFKVIENEELNKMVDSNIHREEILPSEKAFAYKMKIEAISHQGKQEDTTCAQVYL